MFLLAFVLFYVFDICLDFSSIVMCFVCCIWNLMFQPPVYCFLCYFCICAFYVCILVLYVPLVLPGRVSYWLTRPACVLKQWGPCETLPEQSKTLHYLIALFVHTCLRWTFLARLDYKARCETAGTAHIYFVLSVLGLCVSSENITYLK